MTLFGVESGALRGPGAVALEGRRRLAGRGRVTALLSPAGTGKSTLPRTLAGGLLGPV